MKKMFREVNVGARRRFNVDDPFRFEDFLDPELGKILLREAKNCGITIPLLVRGKVIKQLAALRSGPNFGNAGAAVQQVSRAKGRLALRDPLSRKFSLADFDLEHKDSDGMAPLSGLFKIDHVKSELVALKLVIGQCEKDGKDPSEYLKNYVFVGNPGTGKTTVARAMAEMLHSLGILATNSIKTCSGLDLQGAYVGQTKEKVNEVMADAQGGVLFIDEAYTLYGGTVYATEAIDQLVQLMTEPEHLHKTVVILAGYTSKMDEMLAGANPGLRSRVNGRIEFPDWDPSDCVNYVHTKSDEEGIALERGAAELLKQELIDIKSRPGWANARDSVLLRRLLYTARAKRLANAAEVGPPSYARDDARQAMTELQKLRPVAEPGEAAHQRRGPAPAIMAQVEELHRDFLQAQVEHHEECVSVEHEQREESSSALAEPDLAGDAGRMFAALLEACREAGYDKSHESRQDLIQILGDVIGGEDFPEDIMSIVLQKTGSTKKEALKMLRPQVHRVLKGMTAAVAAEEERRAEIRRIEEEIKRMAAEKRDKELRELEAKKRAREEYQRRAQELLKSVGKCSAGFTFHRVGSGRWQCAGGTHFVSDHELGLVDPN
jgi:SpoVK/Ycf46/Vps4 family AAA+-type ATPase